MAEEVRAPQPIKIFYSYSRQDSPFLQELRKHLSPLRRQQKIEDWYDLDNPPGAEWEPAILHHLRQADLILLLVTANFFDSDYCFKELDEALDRHEENEAIVIPILVDDVSWEGTSVAKLGALPPSGRPVALWEHRNRAWKEVAKGIAGVVEDLQTGIRPVVDALSGVRGVVAEVGASSPARRLAPQPPQLFRSVALFWEARSNLADVSLATVEGTLSQYAPMIIGPPAAKRRLHREFRRAFSGAEAVGRAKRGTLNACLSISAGQMVWRLRDEDSPTLYLGLYNSIVRNSIPVFVTRECYEAQLRPLFQRHGRRTFEARVTGRVTPVKNDFIRDYVDKYGTKELIPGWVMEELCRDVYGLMIDGEGTGVDYLGPPRYLDGDIWLAVEADGRESFVTSFLDVANRKERNEELRELLKEVESLPGRVRIIAQYDDVNELVAQGYHIATKNELIEKVFRFGLGIGDKAGPGTG